MNTNNLWFTSDTHFGHNNIIKFCPKTRPVSTVEEMDKAIIDVWNSRVKPDDTIFHLGDVCWKGDSLLKNCLDQLNGKIHLILGNHDSRRRYVKNPRFESVNDYLEIKEYDQDIILSHYPIYEWNKIQYGSWHLYGHVHGRFVPVPGKCLDVGIDNRKQCDMAPFSFSEIKELLDPVERRSHHGKTV